MAHTTESLPLQTDSLHGHELDYSVAALVSGALTSLDFHLLCGSLDG